MSDLRQSGRPMASDASTSRPATAAPEAAASRWLPRIARVLGIVVLAGVLIGALLYNQWQTEPLKVSGVIEADEIRVGSRIGGRVKHVPVEEGTRVGKGDLLVELEPFDLQERRAEAAAALAQRQETLAKLTAGYRAEEVAQAEVQVRREQLSLLQAGTREEEIDQAQAQVEEAYQAWMLQKSGFRSEEVAEAQAAVEAAQAALEAIERQLEELRITAPADAVVDAVELEPGDLISANAPAISLVDMSELWVRAYVPEDALSLQLGQAVEVTVDSHPGQTFAGTLTFIARQGEFTPSNIQTPEERSKQVFRIKVTLQEGLDVLRPGMYADVWLEPRGGE